MNLDLETTLLQAVEVFEKLSIAMGKPVNNSRYNQVTVGVIPYVIPHDRTTNKEVSQPSASGTLPA